VYLIHARFFSLHFFFLRNYLKNFTFIFFMFYEKILSLKTFLSEILFFFCNWYENFCHQTFFFTLYIVNKAQLLTN